MKAVRMFLFVLAAIALVTAPALARDVPSRPLEDPGDCGDHTNPCCCRFDDPRPVTLADSGPTRVLVDESNLARPADSPAGRIATWIVRLAWARLI